MPVQKPIKITETVLRDAHQSLIATRMPTELMLPIVDKMDKVGYHSVECWGGRPANGCQKDSTCCGQCDDRTDEKGVLWKSFGILVWRSTTPDA